jgi:hypothetical protein
VTTNLNTAAERPRIEKLRACLVQIEAALFLMIRGGNPVPIHTLLSASKGILSGLNTAVPNSMIQKMESSVDRVVKPGFEKEWHRYTNRAANFFKHADRDPFDELDGVDIEGVNRVDAVVCILAVWEYVKELPLTILIGLLFVSESTKSFFDFHSFLSEREEGKQLLYELSQRPDNERDKFLLDVFELSLKTEKCASRIPIPSLGSHGS